MFAGFLFYAYICKRIRFLLLLTKQKQNDYEEEIHLRRLWIYL